MSITSKT
jgi:hypothetical protein